MGNQLTGIAPSQILPVEHYLTDIPEYEYVTSLGSTRFFKVAQAQGREGLAVAKVFVIHDPSLPLKTYRDQLEEIHGRLQGASNCLPFQKVTLSDKAALLFRQFVKDSLYDRISTRPFLSLLEKKWLAFQLLCGLNQCHKLGVCHGDIKSENVMVTSWNWILLTDFASFKPTYLPEDNPADFSYFFDTSRRRTCSIAPERFVESSWRNEDPSSLDLTASEVKKGDITPAMDIFSAGCVIAELFTEGTPPFDLSQLLSYRTGEYNPSIVLQKIEDLHIRDLVRHMIQRDPASRSTAEEYLVQQKDGAFPDYFYTFLKLYLQRFACSPVMVPDDRIARIHRDLDHILKNLVISETDPSQNSSLVLIICLVTASLRNLQFCHSKLLALEIMLKLSSYVTSDIVLDRLIPFMLHFVNDAFPHVRAESVRTITQCLAKVVSVPVSDANVFPEYILPQMSHLTQDGEAIVRVAYAENIAMLAETALRFLEIVQLRQNETKSNEASTSSSQTTSQYKATYDMELQALHEMIQQKVVTLLSDPDNVVKQTLLQNGITRLCVFFGRQKANDVLLSHMITFLNDKYDWNLRGTFFDSIIGVAAYVGWQSSTILKPLLQQGLSDTEEFVIQKTLCALISLSELSLLQKPMLHEMMAEVVPFLCHPNVWIRQGAVGFVSTVARQLNIADVHCNLLPLVQPYIKHPVVQVEDELVVLNALQDPVSRSIYDYIVRSQQIQKLFETLQDRQLLRNICRPGHQTNYGEMEESLAPVFRKLTSQGMTTQDEDKLLAMKDFILKIHKARAGSSDSSVVEVESPRGGTLNMRGLGSGVCIRHAELFKPGDPRLESQMNLQRKLVAARKVKQLESPSLVMNEDWKQMFGSADSGKMTESGKVGSVAITAATGGSSTSAAGKTKQQNPLEQIQHPAIESQKEAVRASSEPRQLSRSQQSQASSSSLSLSQSTVTVSISQLQSSTDSLKSSGSSQTATSSREKHIQAKSTACKLELRQLVAKKREEFASDQLTKDLLDSLAWESKPAASGWKPKGLLVAHLHEHRGAVNRIQVSQDQMFFATCSNDGTVKLWDCSKMEGKSVTNRSRHTYNKQGGQIKTLTFCDSYQCLASASDSGAIHVFKVESNGPRILHTKNLDVDAEGLIVDMSYFDTGSQNVVCYATVHGLLVGWDLRAPRIVWKLKNDPKHGLITTFQVQQQQSWLALATSSGMHVCWDMRFQLPITSVSHPTGARVRRLVIHPQEQSTVISAVQGNNEASIWDMETGARQRTLWASPLPPLSTTKTSGHSLNGLHLGGAEGNTFLLAAGSDMRIRYWDLHNPAGSFIMAYGANDHPSHTVVSYRSRLIEGTEVIQETYNKARTAVNEDIPRRGPDMPAVGHRDIISDIALCQTSQTFVITCSRDGVVKVWK